MNQGYFSGTLERIIHTKTAPFKDGPTTVTSFTLKCNEGKNTEFIKFEAFGGPADAINAMPIGSFVFVKGQFRTNSWDDKKTGQKVYDSLIKVNNLAKMDIKAQPKAAPVQQASPAPVAQPAPAPVQQEPQLVGASVTSDDVVPF